MIIIGVAVALFLLAFLTKRRFGVLGLGLAAGALLANSWTTWLADALTAQGIAIDGFSNHNLAAIILIIAPALILLGGGPKYHKPMAAVIGGLGFAVMGFLLTLSLLQGSINTTDQATKQLIAFTSQYQSGLVALGVVIAVIDMFLAQGKKSGHGKKKHAAH